MQLRDYQRDAVNATFDWFSRGGGNPLIVAPTGAGKSVILSELIRRAVGDWPGTKIVCATHVKELIQQNFQALMRLWPAASAGIYSAGLGRRQASRAVTFAGIQTVAKRAKEFGYVDLLIVDEAHLISRKGTTQYQKFIAALMDANPNLKVIGLTATPFRLDSGRLDGGKDALFNGIAYDIPVQMLVERGYLAPLVSKSPSFTFNTKGMKKRGGDFTEAEMNARFNTMEATKAAVEEITRLGHNRKSWLLFCIGVDHATSVCAELHQYGIEAAVVTGETPAADRAFIIKEFKAGRLRAIVNVSVFTTGFDAPATDLLAFLRPTESLGLYMQMAGRGMRTAPGKETCLVLDYAGNVSRHGPVDAINVAAVGRKGDKKGDAPGDAPAKTCPDCSSILWIGARECSDCGHVFPEPEPRIEGRASTAAIMNMTAEEDWREITDFNMARHVKAGATIASMRVEYLIDGDVVREFVCFEHSGFPRQKAVQWWHTATGTSPPDTVAEALRRRDEVRVPAEAVVRREGRYNVISRVRGTVDRGRVA